MHAIEQLYEAHPLKDDYPDATEPAELWSDERIAQVAGALAHFAVYRALLWRVIRPMRDEYEIALSKARG